MTTGLVPTERDAALQRASALRRAGRLPEALALLTRLQAQHPRFSRLYQELGHCRVLLADAAGAIEALGEAVRLNPTLPASWDMLEQLHRMAGDAASADEAAHHLATLKLLPRALVAAASLLADDDVATAEAILTQYLRGDGDNAGALRMLARIKMQRGVLDEAEDLLRSVLALAPDYHAARLDYALVLLQQQKHVHARQEAERLLEHDPSNRDYLKQHAAACVGLGDHRPVIDIYQQLLDDQPLTAAEVADLRLWRANALKTTGRTQEAVADYRAALAAKAANGVAWFSLANLKTYRFSDSDIAQMRETEAQPDLQEMDRIYLCFALGKALEDRGDHASSWRWYERGNALRRRSSRYRPEAAEATAARLARTFTAEAFAERAGWGATDTSPIFVLGLPRSGSTLIEQILASHSQVEGTQELLEISRYAGEICGLDPDCGLPQNPEALLRLSAADARQLGERFLSDTSAYRRSSRPFFIDKMPGNFWHVGFIHLILPGAKIIDVRRDPMACGFSNFKQLFGGANQEFSYDLGHLARHYHCYLALMRHWEDVLPGRVLTMRYEDVVGDLETALRRILAHCGLGFEQACLSFYETERSVRTPSSEQVRRPIAREGLSQWRSYEPWLGALRQALGDATPVFQD